MQVQISGKHMDVGEALRSRISDELLSSIGKYFERGGDADVVVGKSGHSFQVDCTVRLASGHRLESSGAGGDAHAAFGDALNKVETRIRRYKRRLKNHHHPSGKIAETASMMVLRAPDPDATENHDRFHGGDGDGPDRIPGNRVPKRGPRRLVGGLSAPGRQHRLDRPGTDEIRRLCRERLARGRIVPRTCFGSQER
jgi:ribosomal subunit interface protein